MEQKKQLKTKGMIMKKSKMQDKRSMQKGIQGTTCTTTNSLTVGAMKLASDRVAAAPVSMPADVEMAA